MLIIRAAVFLLFPMISKTLVSGQECVEPTTSGWSCLGEGQCMDPSGNWYSNKRFDLVGGARFSPESSIARCVEHQSLGLAGVSFFNERVYCYYQTSNIPTDITWVGNGEGVPAQLYGLNYSCYKNDGDGVVATTTTTTTTTPAATTTTTTADATTTTTEAPTRLSLYDGYKVEGKPVSESNNSPCNVDAAKTIHCGFQTTKDDVVTNPPTDTRLNAKIVLASCSTTDFDDVTGTDSEFNAREVSATADASTVHTTAQKNCDGASQCSGEDDEGPCYTDAGENSCRMSTAFCSRSELFDTTVDPPMGILAEILQGFVTYTYGQGGTFTTSIETTEYVPTDVSTEDQGIEAGLSAFRCDTNGTEITVDTTTGEPKVKMGDELNLCILSTNLDATVIVTSLLLDTQVGDLISTLISTPENGETTPSLLTSVNSIDSEDGSTIIIVRTLMTPGIFDVAGGETITASGSADLTYVGRKLKQFRFRTLQDSTSDSFSVEFELARNELPAVAMNDQGNSASAFSFLGVMASLVVGAFMIM